MKKIEKHFDRVTQFAKQATYTWTLAFLLMGFISMAEALISSHVFAKDLAATGFFGILLTYIGIGLLILSIERRSLIAKLAVIIAIPIVIAFGVVVYVY